ncbi:MULTISPECIES: phage head spike fiber domain-containing protein [Halocynthiibacter]|uniref:Uncharacterized protein n=1 Tax=Halocynthiibacter halioticoli TaxID=2986804 RepID=A0AAE3IWP9_9RHOB|nr:MULTISPECIES: hypothetical protein [Halocynthiibacter]MCV6823114.1 hypothetical protein [Halocynthiibacter halioticoli]MCW4056115.1 hypothetical protein [Halocynthiibacter sp. SDUM655004]
MIGYGLSYTAAQRKLSRETVFDFTGGSLPLNVSHSRSTGAYHFDQSGNISEVASDVPRFDHDPVTGVALGLLLETQSTNLIAHSRANTTNWIKDACNANALSLNALGEFDGVEVSSTGMIWGRLKTIFNVTAAETYAITAYYRAGTSQNARFAFSGLPGGETHFSGPVGNLSETRTQIGSVTAFDQTLLADGTTYRARFFFTPNVSGSVEFGLGPQSGTSGDSIVLLGAQAEHGNSHGSYIRTSGQVASRASDICGVAGLSGIYDVTAKYGDSSEEALAAQSVSAGYWPPLTSRHLRSLRFSPV